MFGFFGRWMSDAANLILALVIAIFAIQMPTLTSGYVAGLLQVTNDERRDIDQREQSARAYYHFEAGTDEQVIEALRSTEPSNAQSLAQSVSRFRILRNAYDSIVHVPPLLQPPVALLDLARDEHGYKLAILGTTIDTYIVQIAFSKAATVYGIIGLVLGSLIAQALVSLAGAIDPFRRHERIV